MSRTLLDLPEVAALETRQGVIRIPPQTDVPITPRVQAVVDTAAFRRLDRISQLGFVQLVYPGAHHTRFEHSLGVYRLALQFLKRLAHNRAFRRTVRPVDADRLIVAALLHDIGHWPFCHLIEDLQLPNVPKHEDLALAVLSTTELGEVLRQHWQLSAEDATTLMQKGAADRCSRLLASILSGPIDADKMDYLRRDSLHAGVPYGQNFDQGRLIGSLCLNEREDGLAITTKGTTAAELMVFARYVMFSEVYWHHAVRAATAMFHRAFYLLQDRLQCEQLFLLDEATFISHLVHTARGTPAAALLDGIFGPQRRLYKRWTEASQFDQPRLYGLLARRPYPWLERSSHRLADRLSARIGRPVLPEDVLIDAPPAKLEVQFDVQVCNESMTPATYRPLGELSPVVRTLAEQQFDDYVKRVRLFVHPRLASLVGRDDATADWLIDVLGS